MRDRLRTLAEERGTTSTELLEDLAGGELGAEYIRAGGAGRGGRPAGNRACQGGTGRVLVPSLAVLAAERRTPGAGRHAASLRFAEQVPFGVAHATDAMDWSDVAEPVAHAAAVVRQAVRTGEPVTLLSLDPALYAATGVTPLDPT